MIDQLASPVIFHDRWNTGASIEGGETSVSENFHFPLEHEPISCISPIRLDLDLLDQPLKTR